MKLIVGMDFGTSTTVVRYRVEGSNEIKPLKADNGMSDIIPTIIFRPKNGGNTVYGIQAEQMIANHVKGEPIVNFKMDLLSSDPDTCEKAKANIVDYLTFIHSLFMQEIKALHPDAMDVYISYPAKWNNDMVTFMKNAVEEAGFKGEGVTVKGMKEPQAASLNTLRECQLQLKNSGILKPGEPLRVLMLDMGAGTSDVSIFKLEITDGGGLKISELLSYPSISEPVLCGGREIDVAIQKYFVDMCEAKGMKLMPECVELFGMKQWKENTLSQCLKNGFEVTIPSNLSNVLGMVGRSDIADSFSMERKDFEKLTQSHWKKLYQLIRSAFAQYEFAKPEDVDIVLLTGGHSNWYTVPKLFNGEGLVDGLARIGKDPEALNFKKIIKEPSIRLAGLQTIHPHECVAMGLCLVDENVEFEPRSSNNVWAKINILDSESAEMQIVDKNDILPKVQNISFSKTIKRHVLFEEHSFKSSVSISTGETLGDADTKCYEFEYDGGKSFWEVLLSIILVLPFLVRLEYELRVSMKITMTVEGELKVEGTVIFDGKEVMMFTEKNLKLV